MAANHDKLGNGYAAFAHMFKKTGSGTLDRIRKALEKRSMQKLSRKLFSIYRYRVANINHQQRKQMNKLSSAQDGSNLVGN